MGVNVRRVKWKNREEPLPHNCDRGFHVKTDLPDDQKKYESVEHVLIIWMQKKSETLTNQTICSSIRSSPQVRTCGLGPVLEKYSRRH